MEDLDLNKLLEYYNGFSFENGEPLIWNNCTMEQSKNLAYSEITNRSKKYQANNEVENRIQELSLLNNDLKSILRNPTDIFIIDTGHSSETSNFCRAISMQSNMLYNEKLPEINSQIIEKLEEIELIWKDDPDNLRYQSKFGGRELPCQYIKDNIKIYNWICTEKQDFRVNISSYYLDRDFLNIIAQNASKYEVIIYPIYNGYDGLSYLNAFIINLSATNQKNLKLIICWIYNRSDDIDLNELNKLKRDEKIEEISNNIFLSINHWHVIINSKESEYSYRGLIDKI